MVGYLLFCVADTCIMRTIDTACFGHFFRCAGCCMLTQALAQSLVSCTMSTMCSLSNASNNRWRRLFWTLWNRNVCCWWWCTIIRFSTLIIDFASPDDSLFMRWWCLICVGHIAQFSMMIRWMICWANRFAATDVIVSRIGLIVWNVWNSLSISVDGEKSSKQFPFVQKPFISSRDSVIEWKW